MSALEYIRKQVIVDIDQLNPGLAAKLGPFCDMTSNQALIAGLVTANAGSDIVKRVIARARIEASGLEAQVELALDLFAVLFAKEVLPHITGRVHAQLSPRYAHSVQLQLPHAHRLISLFAVEGISPSRICLKIPSTGAGLAVAAVLEKEGIRTLATTVFSVDQALGAAQAGCLYIAPYFNELSVHFEPESWVEYDDTAREHPMSSVIREIVRVYREEIPQDKRPLIMPASIVTTKEALAISTLGVDHITLSGKIVEALAVDEYAQEFRGTAIGVDADTAKMSIPPETKEAHSKVDFLADSGKALDESIEANESVRRRLLYALQAFGKCEQAIVDVIKEQIYL